MGSNDTTGETESSLVSKIWQIQERMRITSSCRFSASKRIRFDWNLAQLTVVVLSLWSIAISYLLLPGSLDISGDIRIKFQSIGILLPVFIVAFSLIERGENYVRSYQLDNSARQLREIGDDLTAAVIEANSREDHLLDALKTYSSRYNHSLERCPVSHDDIDYWLVLFTDIVSGHRYAKWYRAYALVAVLILITRKQMKRTFYISLWLAPALYITLIPAPSPTRAFPQTSPAQRASPCNLTESASCTPAG
ncbi:SLATT domain-containing protein [Sphingomonas canadensis]|uniref:SLATT domain-containing protein n=1 Tax=Sphingomonas canadensis TaxID=1219257 RepID=A0ABW3H685_9SPHN|nr:SLATT domain-containing protein [Sphingomonas canadensis]MCW3836880.1 SLATT domain-containing protein [Sphingomonas canadensis]